MAPRGHGSDIRTVCPQCGEEDQVPESACQSCRHYIFSVPDWAQSPRRRRILTWRRGGVLGILMLLVGTFVWTSYPFFPNPVTLLFKRPSTSVTSASLPGQWAMRGRDLQQSSYVSSFSRQPEGRLVWSLDLGTYTRSAPAVVDGIIYIGGDFKIIALNAETSETIWELPTTGPVHSSPAVAGEMLYLGLLDKHIIALDRESGQLRWAFEAEVPTPGSAAVDNGMVYMGTLDGFVYALDAETGELIWKHKSNGSVASPPVIYEGNTYASSSGGSLYARNSRTGDRRLRFRTGAQLLRTPVAGNGLVYFESDGKIIAVDAGARDLPLEYQLKSVWAQLWIWQFPVPNPPGQAGGRWRVSPARVSPEGREPSFFFPPAVTPEALYVKDTQGLFYAIDALKGIKLWRFPAEGPNNTPAVVVGRRVYFGTEAGLLYALDRFNGEPLWELSLGAPVVTQPVFSEGRLYVRTRDGKLHSIE